MLDNLRKLDAAASPGPWYGDERYVVGSPKWGRTQVRNRRGGETIGQMGYNDETTKQEREADAQLAALSHHILPLAEALDKSLCWHQEAEVSSHNGECFDDDVSCEGRPCGRCAVLAQLKEALDE